MKFSRWRASLVNAEKWHVKQPSKNRLWAPTAIVLPRLNLINFVQFAFNLQIVVVFEVIALTTLSRMCPDSIINPIHNVWEYALFYGWPLNHIHPQQTQ